MDRMDHFRGKLFHEEQVVLDLVDGYLGSHLKRNGNKEWFGTFEFASDQLSRVASGERFRLVLEDGRAGNVFLDLHNSNSPGKSAAEFHVVGNFNKR